MKKLNKKGFTMVEMLAAVSIMAILAGVAISAVSRYQEHAWEEAYKAMETSAYDAAQNYITDKGIVVPTSGSKTLEIVDLIDAGYLDKLEDPRAKGYYCHNGSKVEVTKTKGSNGSLDKYTYNVVIVCEFYTSSHYEGDTEVEGVIFKS